MLPTPQSILLDSPYSNTWKPEPIHHDSSMQQDLGSQAHVRDLHPSATMQPTSLVSVTITVSTVAILKAEPAAPADIPAVASAELERGAPYSLIPYYLAGIEQKSTQRRAPVMPVASELAIASSSIVSQLSKFSFVYG